MSDAINIIFDGPPGPEAGRFVEVENDDREGVSVGEWIERDDGLWALRITAGLHETKPAYCVSINSDLTEGRGHNYPIAICESLTTAKRKGQGKNVQGSDAKIYEISLLKVFKPPFSYDWYGPVKIEDSTSADLKEDERINAKNAALEKARAAGLTDDDLKALGDLS